MAHLKIKETTVKEIKIMPCIKCGSHKIEIDDCGYSSFNVAWGKCLDCKHEVKISPCGCFIHKQTIAEAWNKANDLRIILDDYANDIQSIKNKIKELPKLETWIKKIQVLGLQ